MKYSQTCKSYSLFAQNGHTFIRSSAYSNTKAQHNPSTNEGGLVGLPWLSVVGSGINALTFKCSKVVSFFRPLEYAYIREVAVALLVVQPVSDHKLVGDLETDIGKPDVYQAHAGAVEEGTNTQGSGLAAPQQLKQVSERQARINHIFHYEHMPARHRLVQVFDHAHSAALACFRPVGRDGKEIDAHRY